MLFRYKSGWIDCDSVTSDHVEIVLLLIKKCVIMIKEVRNHDFNVAAVDLIKICL